MKAIKNFLATRWGTAWGTAKNGEYFIAVPNPPDPLHLLRVAQEMEELGPPVVRCVLEKNIFWALEGSHRIAAAYSMFFHKKGGQFAEVLEVSKLEIINGHDCLSKSGQTLPSSMRAGEIVKEIQEARSYVLYPFFFK